MENHSHHWKLKPYESYISVGLCGCGAKRYFVKAFGLEAFARANELNKELGWDPVKYRPSATENINKHKEETMTSVRTEEKIARNVDLPPMPPKPGRRKRVPKYYEENKVAIRHDYRSLKLREFLARWKIATTTWIKLKKDWSIQGKNPPHIQYKKIYLRSQKSPPCVSGEVHRCGSQRTSAIP